MELLVSDIFQLSKLDIGQIHLQLEQVELVSWLASLLDRKHLMFHQRSLTWNLYYKNPQTYVYMDRGRMAQVINNLLENSMMYSENGAEITVSIHEEEDQVRIEIKDTGIGIPAEDLPHIWERFCRVDKSRSVDLGGSGLGLAIVKELIDLHGGSISVESELGKGSIFTIFLRN